MKKLRPTKSRRTEKRLQDASRNVSKTLQETYLQSSWETLLKCTEGKNCYKYKVCLHQMLIKLIQKLIVKIIYDIFYSILILQHFYTSV